MRQYKVGRYYFIYGLIMLCLLYLIAELFINAYTMISVDEFWFAHRIYQYKSSLPYRDFAPYKTVMGYYLLLLPMLIAHGSIGTLIFTKNIIALLNTCVFFSTAMWLTRFFNKAAIFTSLSLLITAEVVLLYSTNIRVDLLAYWLGLFSILLLLETQTVFAGILIGLGFIVSQKVVWYLLATNCAFLAYGVSINFDKKILWKIIRFNLAAAAVIAVYIAIWSWFSNWHSVISSVFSEATALYQLDWYNATRKLFWYQTLVYNPLLFLLCPLVLISLLITYQADESYTRRFLVIMYALTIIIFLLPFKQPFPYYMQVTIPVFFILYAAFYHWLFDIFLFNHQPILLVKRTYLLIFIAMYSAMIMYVVLFMGLPKAYLLLEVVPLCSGYFFLGKTTRNMTACIFNLLCITGVFVGFIYPSTLAISRLMLLNGSYQKANIEALQKITADGSDYLAGIDLLYNKSQPISGLKHLMGPAIDYLYHPNEKLRLAMLTSLDENPSATISSVLADLKKSQVKVYVNNYRIMALPEEIQNYLSSQYQHWWGSIYVYAPIVPAGKNKIMLKFSGQYWLQSPDDNHILLNNKVLMPHSRVTLQKGTYASDAKSAYRLKMVPPFLPHSNTIDMDMDQWEKLTF